MAAAVYVLQNDLVDILGCIPQTWWVYWDVSHSPGGYTGMYPTVLQEVGRELSALGDYQVDCMNAKARIQVD